MKKKGSRRRGVEYQLWCKKWLEAAYPGIAVHNQPMNHFRLPSGVWACRSNDIFGCIDLVAVKKDAKVLFIQCSVHQKTTARLKEFLGVPWNLNTCSVQLWLKRPNGSTTIKALEEQPSGEITLVDKCKIKRGKIDAV